MRRCRICGCTDSNACITEDGPCCWIWEDLCSACDYFPDGDDDDEPQPMVELFSEVESNAFLRNWRAV
jgi:hypothetical protein